MAEDFSQNKEQQNKIFENKIMILYLIDRMELPLSNSQLQQFALEQEYMDYFSLQQSLSEMVATGYLEQFQNDNTTRYTITEEGINVLEYFEKQLSPSLRSDINQYVGKNRKNVRKDYEVTANHFYNHSNGEYIVKCCVYEDETMLMEVALSVVSREQAKLICNNWKEHVKELYGNILNELIRTDNNI